MAVIQFCLALLVLWFDQYDGARILAYFPLPTWSHYMQYQPMYDVLLQNGHEIVMYSPYPPTQNRTNFTHIYADNPFFVNLLEKFTDLKEFEYESKSFLEEAKISHDLGLESNKDVLEHPTFIELMNSQQTFDLVLLESFFYQEATILLSHHFNCPVIMLNSIAIKFDILDSMGSPNIIPMMPELYSFFTDEMSFLERFQNTYVTLIRYFFRKIRYRQIDSMAGTRFGPNIPSVENLLQKTSISFQYSSPALEYTYPKVPTIIEVGGLHIPKSEPPLSRELKKILDEAKDGFVYFSLGSVLTPKQLPEDLTQTILQAFSTFKHLQFIWKWVGENPVQNLPPNIVERKWFPQRAILAHPNCKLFITHGGMSSQIESIYYGVPMVTIPFFGDQFKNAAKVEHFGLGLSIHSYNVTKEALEWAIRTVTSNTKFQENVSKRSQIMRDLPLSPLETTVYWVEYVLRHKGTSHFTSAANKLYWFQYYLLDVFGVVLVSATLIMLMFYKILALFLSKIKGNGNNVKLKEN